jgi:hypothetical protein
MPENNPDQDQLFEQYKILISSAEEISSRRATANNYLLSVNSLLVTVHALGSSLQPGAPWQIVLPLAGLIICLSWWALIRSYRNVNSAKFKVIHNLESNLASQPYKDEWNLMEKSHIPLSYIEQWIPAVFGCLYLGLLFLA